MAIYAIGDIQGCYDDLMRLLDKIDFSPEDDTLWFAGDLVNRGPKSLAVLRFVKGLGDGAISVLGNHDLHLLAVTQGNRRHLDKEHTLTEILQAPDREELIEWLRFRPLIHHIAKRGYTLLHAGLPPQWDIPSALRYAREVEQQLRSNDYPELLNQMYGNEPNRWSSALTGYDRLRFIINALTRLRHCDANGNLALREKGPPGSQKKPYMPWFRVPGRKSENDRILFGHWSTLGYLNRDNVWSLDTGCLWGGKLTALHLKKRKAPRPVHIACPGARKPHAAK